MHLIKPGDISVPIPTKVKLFAQWKSCYHEPSEKDWEDITGQVTYTAHNVLFIEVDRLIPILCIKLVILEMSHGQSIYIKSMTALYVTNIATEKILTREWSGDAPTMSSFCQTEVNQAFLAASNSCKTRAPYALYNFHSGFVTCHCDEFCHKFKDCCSDFSGAYPNSSLAGSFDNLSELVVACESNQFPEPSHPGIGIFVVTSCLAQFEDTHYSNECRGSGHLAFIPVESHGIVFRNVYCALCNNVKPDNIIPWKASVWGTDAITALRCQQDVESYIFQVLGNATPKEDLDCFWRRGFSYPWGENLLQGNHRLGKMCVIDRDHSHVLMTRQPTYLLQQAIRVSVVKDPQCFCDHCHSSIFQYLTADMSKIADFFLRKKTPWLYVALMNDLVHDGGFSGIFMPEEEGEEEEEFWMEVEPNLEDEHEEDGGDAISEKKLSIQLISLIGSGSSALLLLGILVHLINNGIKSTEAKRIQIGILIGKILLFTAFTGRFVFRRYGFPCKLFAVMVHYAMYVSFGNMIWFGISVAKLLWSVERNLAELSMENRNDGIGKREWMIWGIIWIGILGLMMGFWSYDTYLDGSFFVYGKNEICLMAGKNAVLYLIVVPTTTIVVFNAGLIIYCIMQYLHLMDKKPKMGKNLLKFLARLMAVQTSQWGFGIVYYFTGNITMQYVFEVSVAFEGTFIAISRFMFKT